MREKCRVCGEIFDPMAVTGPHCFPLPATVTVSRKKYISLHRHAARINSIVAEQTRALRSSLTAIAAVEPIDETPAQTLTRVRKIAEEALNPKEPT